MKSKIYSFIKGGNKGAKKLKGLNEKIVKNVTHEEINEIQNKENKKLYLISSVI